MIINFSSPPSTRLPLCIISHGGSGSTMLISFLGKYVRTNSWNSMVDGLKHCNSPDHPIIRAARPRRIIYCYDDPRITILSLFRRSLAREMQSKLRYFSSNIGDYRELAEAHLPRVACLEDFLLLSYDCFGINYFWHNWTRSPMDCPMLLVKFEKLWDSLPEIFSFAGVSPDHISNFPGRQERLSRLDALSIRDLAILNRIYGATVSEMERMPACSYRMPSLEYPPA